MKLFRKGLLFAFVIFGVGACSNDIETTTPVPKVEEQDNIQTSTDEAKDESGNMESQSNETTTHEPESSSSNTNPGEESENPLPMLKEKYEGRQWSAEQEGILYGMTVEFLNEKEGTFDWNVSEAGTGNILEDMTDIPFTLEENSNDQGALIAYYQYEDEFDGTLVDGMLKFQEDSIEFARYRFSITLQ